MTALPRAQTLFNLLLFIQWPEQQLSSKELVLCSLSDSAMTSMQPYLNQSVHGRTLSLKKISNALDELESCNAIYEANMPADTLRKVVAFAKKTPLLIVLEGASSIDRGAMVGLDFSAKQPLIYINLRLLQQSRLSAHPALLASARRVIR